MKAWQIYVLFDPADGLVRYVGWTINSRVRLRDHCKPSNLKKSSYCARWIASVVAVGRRPVMAIIENRSSGDWKRAERMWVSYFIFAGARLTNATDGGEGAPGRLHTDAAKAAMSAKRKGRKPHPNAMRRTSELNKGVKRPPEWSAKISAALSGRPKSEAHREKIRKMNVGRKHTAEHTEKVRLKLRGRVHGPMKQETKDKLSAAMLGRNSKSKKAWWAARTADERSEVARKGWAAISPERRGEIMREKRSKRRGRRNVAAGDHSTQDGSSCCALLAENSLSRQRES